MNGASSSTRTAATWVIELLLRAHRADIEGLVHLTYPLTSVRCRWPVHNGGGFFTGDGAQAVENPSLLWRYVERSNVELIRQMTDMITCQRALQSCASVTKM